MGNSRDRRVWVRLGIQFRASTLGFGTRPRAKVKNSPLVPLAIAELGKAHGIVVTPKNENNR